PSAPSALPSVPPSAPARLGVSEITKTFPGVTANDRVTMGVRGGEVHALLGENGAGKTTLMNILYGLYQPDAGEIVIDGRAVRIRSPRDAIAYGIGMVPQHFLRVRRHRVAENIALGFAGTRFFLPARDVETQINAFADRYGLRVDPRAAIWQLSVSEQQRVEILKALLRGAGILILDEPTSVLTPQEASQLFAVLRRMKEEGKSVIFITHKLDEVMAVADCVTVMRKGRVVDTVPVAMTSKSQLARRMAGRGVDVRGACRDGHRAANARDRECQLEALRRASVLPRPADGLCQRHAVCPAVDRRVQHPDPQPAHAGAPALRGQHSETHPGAGAGPPPRPHHRRASDVRARRQHHRPDPPVAPGAAGRGRRGAARVRRFGRDSHPG